jgi:hypothetical protein
MWHTSRYICLCLDFIDFKSCWLEKYFNRKENSTTNNLIIVVDFSLFKGLSIEGRLFRVPQYLFF